MIRPQDRVPLCLMGALCLHAAPTLLGSCETRNFPAEAQAALNPLSIDVALEAPQPGRGAPPGGGSPAPDPEAGAKAIPRAVSPAARAIEVREPTEQPETETEPAVDETLTTPEDDATLLAVAAPKLRPARTFAPLTQRAEGAVSRFAGSGEGANGGPGGPGSGYGKGRGGSPFGGSSGAFRADVCFIPEHTRNLKQLNGVCPPVLTLFTDVLDVPPRSFTDGFPGVSDRFEWFAVFYRGKFTVERANHYRFRVLSDDGSILFIDGYRIIDNDGQHEPQSKQMTIPLEAGEHEFFLQYYQGHREIIALQLFVRPDGEEERLFSPKL